MLYQLHYKFLGTSPAGTGPLSNGTAAAVNRAATNPISNAIISNGGTSSGSSLNLFPAPAGAPTAPNVMAPAAAISVVPVSPTPDGSPASQNITTAVQSLAADQQLYAASYAAGPYAVLPGLSAPELAALQAAVEPAPEEAPAVASAPEVAAALATSVNPTATLGYELGHAIDAMYGQGTAAAFQAHDRFLGPFSVALQQNSGQCMANGTQLRAGSIGDFMNTAFCNLTGTVAVGAIGNTGVVSNLSEPQSMVRLSSSGLQWYALVSHHCLRCSCMCNPACPVTLLRSCLPPVPPVLSVPHWVSTHIARNIWWLSLD